MPDPFADCVEFTEYRRPAGSEHRLYVKVSPDIAGLARTLPAHTFEGETLGATQEHVSFSVYGPYWEDGPYGDITSIIVRNEPEDLSKGVADLVREACRLVHDAPEELRARWEEVSGC